MDNVYRKPCNLERIKDIKHEILKGWLLLAAVDLGST